MFIFVIWGMLEMKTFTVANKTFSFFLSILQLFIWLEDCADLVLWWILALLMLNCKQCITQEFQEVKKIQSAIPVQGSTFCIVSHAAVLKTFLCLLLLTTPKSTKLYKLTQCVSETAPLYASQRPWLNFEPQLAGHFGTYSPITWQNKSLMNPDDKTVQPLTTQVLPRCQTALESRQPVPKSKRGKVRKKSSILAERRNPGFSGWGDYYI